MKLSSAKHWPVLASLLLVLLSFSSYAAVQNSHTMRTAFSESDYFSSVPVVLTPTRLSQPVIAAPAAVTVINRRMIEASGAQEIADLLRLVPGFQVGYFNGISMSLTYHGFTGNYDRRLQVLIDGRSVYMPLLSTVEWLSLPLDISEIEKIEVVRGSNTPVYGANSFQGVINIITRKSFQDLGAKISTTFGAHNLRRVEQGIREKSQSETLRYINNRKVLAQYAAATDESDMRLTISQQKDNGFDEVNDSKKLSLLHYVLNHQVDNKTIFSAQFGARYGVMDTFASGDEVDPYREKAVRSIYQSLNWNRAYSQDQVLEWRFYHNYFKQDDEYSFGEVQQGIYFGIAERFDIEVQYTFRPRLDLRIVSGAGARLDRVKSRHLLNDDEPISDKSTRFYTNMEWHPYSAIIVNAGVMVERNQQIGAYFSPRLALNLLLDDQQVIRAAATRALRTPSILENHLDLAFRLPDGQPLARLHYSENNLKAETLDSIEIGYLFYDRRQRFNFDSKIFLEKIRNGILETKNHATADQPWEWGNNTWADIWGIETQISFRPSKRILLNLAHAYLQADVSWRHDINVPDIGEEIRDISQSVPEKTISALFSYSMTHNFDWSMMYYGMSYMHWLQDGSKLHGYDRFDTRFAWTEYLAREKQFQIALVLQNLGNAYREVQYQTMFERRAFLTLTYEW